MKCIEKLQQKNCLNCNVYTVYRPSLVRSENFLTSIHYTVYTVCHPNGHLANHSQWVHPVIPKFMTGQPLLLSLWSLPSHWLKLRDWRVKICQEAGVRESPLIELLCLLALHLPPPRGLTILWLPPGFQAVGGECGHDILHPVAGGGVNYAFDIDVGGVTHKAFLLFLKRQWRLGEREIKMSVGFLGCQADFSQSGEGTDNEHLWRAHSYRIHWNWVFYQEQI